MGTYLAQVVKAFTASGPGQLSLKVGDVVEVQTGDNAWSLGHIALQESRDPAATPYSTRGTLAGVAGEDGWFPSVCIAPIPANSDADKGADGSHIVETRPAQHDGHGQYHPSVSATISASVQLSPSKEYGSFSQGNTILKDSKDRPHRDADLLSSHAPTSSAFASQYPLVVSLSALQGALAHAQVNS